MSLPDAGALMCALDATWPAREVTLRGGWVLRDGAGGGKRVSAASAHAPGGDIAQAEGWMRARGMRPLFRLRPEEAGLDAALAARGYALRDPTVIYAAPVGMFDVPPPVSLFDIWPPLAIMREIWQAGGITAPRRAVMARVVLPRTALLARSGDRAAGVGFVALHAGIAILHAVEVVPGMRRQGAGRLILQGAGAWAVANGARWLALAVTEANAGARGLYEGAGMAVVSGYHYREAGGGV